MSLGSVLLTAIGLAMDCFAVCLCTGMLMERRQVLSTLRMVAMFGVFQAAMPTVSWFGGLAFRSLIENVGHWVAFGLLAMIGSKMIYEALHADQCEVCPPTLGWSALLVLSVATSIDALAVGLSLSILREPILVPAAVFGLVTVIVSLIGVRVGRRAGRLMHDKVQFVGGVILVAIGVKILLEHLVPAMAG